MLYQTPVRNMKFGDQPMLILLWKGDVLPLGR